MLKCVVNVWAISNWLHLYPIFGTSRGIPISYGPLSFDVSPRSLERVLYFASYIVVDPAGSPLAKRQLLSEQEYREYEAQFNEEGYTIGGKSVVIETVAQRNERFGYRS